MSLPDSIAPRAPARKRAILLAIGWLLALPGLWVILSFILLGWVSKAAGCAPPHGLSFPPCPAGPLASLADALRFTVAITAIGLYVGLGAVPPLYSGLFVAYRIAARIHDRLAQNAASNSRTWIITLGVLFGLLVAAGIAVRIIAAPPSLGEASEVLLGLAFMIALGYGLYRGGRWFKRRLSP